MAVIEKSGSTGKGTTYSLRGHKGVKGAKLNEHPSPQRSLDARLLDLDRALEGFDPEEEIQIQFDKELFLKILNTWLAVLLGEFIVVIQKFNKYFKNPRHYVNLPSPYGGIEFSSKNIDTVIKEVLSQISAPHVHFQSYDSKFTIHTSYGSSKAAGLDTFGCNYNLDVHFSQDWYEILMDNQVMENKRTSFFKRLYHKPLTKQEAQSLAARFGDIIFEHIQASLLKIKTSKGASKGPKGT